MIEPYDDSHLLAARLGRIILHDEHPRDTTEESLARLVARQAEAMRVLREQRDALLKAANDMVSGWDDFMDNENEGQLDSAATQIPKLRAAIKKAEATNVPNT